MGWYRCSQKTVANPTGTATGTLTSIGINGDKYDVQGGGGGIDGSTVTPTDVVATWLACADLHQSYTTLNEVLADRGVLSALMESTNAVDYLVRSTTWASAICADELAMNYIGENNYCADVLLSDSTWSVAISVSTYWEEVLSGLAPTMTSDNTPVGYQAIQDGTYSDYYAYKAFDGNTQTNNNVNAKTSGAWLGIVFPSAVEVYKVGAIQNLLGSTPTYTCNIKVQYSDNGTTWSNTQPSFDTVGGNYKYQTLSANYGKHKYWRIYLNSTSSGGSTGFGFSFLQFYGRSDLPPVDDRINAKADKTDIAPIENGTTASRAYAIGQQFYLNGSLYKAKAAIASGATFTIGTNCELAPNITDQINHENYTMIGFTGTAASHTLTDKLSNYKYVYIDLFLTSGSTNTFYGGWFGTREVFAKIYYSERLLNIVPNTGVSATVCAVDDNHIKVTTSSGVTLRLFGIK